MLFRKGLASRHNDQGRNYGDVDTWVEELALPLNVKKNKLNREDFRSRSGKRRLRGM
ncbi:MAG: hypothetical protein GQ559_09020 [Desulfobulbaceae bacterium]|nr:hypothetical protein [Desulfobulbaceae bacterium]